MASVRIINQFWEIAKSTDQPKRQTVERPPATLPRPVAAPPATRVRLRRSGLTTLRHQIIQAGSVGQVMTYGPGWLVVDFNGRLVKIANSDDRLEVLQ